MLFRVFFNLLILGSMLVSFDYLFIALLFIAVIYFKNFYEVFFWTILFDKIFGLEKDFYLTVIFLVFFLLFNYLKNKIFYV
jgi:hypothetical protein